MAAAALYLIPSHTRLLLTVPFTIKYENTLTVENVQIVNGHYAIIRISN